MSPPFVSPSPSLGPRPRSWTNDDGRQHNRSLSGCYRWPKSKSFSDRTSTKPCGDFATICWLVVVVLVVVMHQMRNSTVVDPVEGTCWPRPIQHPVAGSTPWIPLRCGIAPEPEVMAGSSRIEIRFQAAERVSDHRLGYSLPGICCDPGFRVIVIVIVLQSRASEHPVTSPMVPWSCTCVSRAARMVEPRFRKLFVFFVSSSLPAPGLLAAGGSFATRWRRQAASSGGKFVNWAQKETLVMRWSPPLEQQWGWALCR